MPLGHAVKQQMVFMVRVLCHVIHADDGLALERGSKDFRRSRLWKAFDPLGRDSGHPVVHVRFAGLLIDHIVEECAELGA